MLMSLQVLPDPAPSRKWVSRLGAKTGRVRCVCNNSEVLKLTLFTFVQEHRVRCLDQRGGGAGEDTDTMEPLAGGFESLSVSEQCHSSVFEQKQVCSCRYQSIICCIAPFPMRQALRARSLRNIPRVRRNAGRYACRKSQYKDACTVLEQAGLWSDKVGGWTCEQQDAHQPGYMLERLWVRGDNGGAVSSTGDGYLNFAHAATVAEPHQARAGCYFGGRRAEERVAKAHFTGWKSPWINGQVVSCFLLLAGDCPPKLMCFVRAVGQSFERWR